MSSPYTQRARAERADSSPASRWLPAARILAVLGASCLPLAACSSSTQNDGSAGSAAVSAGAAGQAQAGSAASGASSAGAPSASGGMGVSGAAGSMPQGGASGTPGAGAGSAGAAPDLPVAPWDDELRVRATKSMVPLQAWYDPSTGLWNKNDWWTSANQLETLIDYSRETGDGAYFGDLETTFTKNSAQNFEGFGYYDDDGWWALAWIKAYDLSHQQKYLDMAKTIFKRMSGGWDDKCGGGIYWAWEKSGDNSKKNKNAIPNSLFLTVAARLHLRTPGDAGPGSFLDWAQREWKWFKGTGMLDTDHLVIDSLDSLTACKTTGPKFTYNHGSLIAGLVDLAASTGDTTLLDEASAIAHATMSKMADKNGVLNEAACGGEICVQFKGVFMRSLAYLYRVRPLPEFRTYMRLQSDDLWNSNKNAQNQFGYQWQKPLAPPEVATASRQSSALDALLSAVRSSNLNLALGANASSTSTCGEAGSASLANDGNSRTGSKWCASGAGGQTLAVDLGATRSIVGFRVRHAGAGGESAALDTRDFEIEISADGQLWTRAVTVTGNTSDVTTHGIVPASARQVRLHVSQAQTSTASPEARIYEFEIFGTTL